MSYKPLEFKKIFKAHFLERPNRFLTVCRLENNKVVKAFMPNPGRLWELLFPECVLYLTSDTNSPKREERKTKYTVVAVERDNRPIFLHTHKTNDVVHYLLENKLIPSLKNVEVAGREVTYGKSRFDFLLKEKGKELFMEVKSCTLFGNNIAMFPDAITERGRKHMIELAELSSKNLKPIVLFLVQSDNIKWFMPDYHTDLEFSKTMLEVRNNIRFMPVSIGWNRDLSIKNTIEIVDIPWKYLEKEVEDRGSYILILRILQDKKIEVGNLNNSEKLLFKKGYYLYVGSAMKNLTARINRHLRKIKNFHWHIDYLRDVTDKVTAVPIRSSSRLECKIAESISEIYESTYDGFGSSDCKCPTHLFYSSENPLHSEFFHSFLQKYRMKEP